MGPGLTELSIEVNLRAHGVRSGGRCLTKGGGRGAPRVTPLRRRPLDPLSMLSSPGPNARDLEVTRWDPGLTDSRPPDLLVGASALLTKQNTQPRGPRIFYPTDRAQGEPPVQGLS